MIGAAAGSTYTLSIVACGERFRGAALVTASSMVSVSWSAASFGGPILAGSLMNAWGSDALVGVMVAASLAFVLAALWERRRVPEAGVRGQA